MVTVIQALWLLALSLGRKETRVERVSGGMRGGGDIFLGAWAFKSGRVSGWGGGGRGHEKEGGNGGLGRERQTNEATTNPAMPSLLLRSSSGPWGKISHE